MPARDSDPLLAQVEIPVNDFRLDDLSEVSVFYPPYQLGPHVAGVLPFHLDLNGVAFAEDEGVEDGVVEINGSPRAWGLNLLQV